jgi:hypothetical protein
MYDNTILRENKTHEKLLQYMRMKTFKKDEIICKCGNVYNIFE